MDPFWSVGVLVVAYAVAQVGQGIVDANRDVVTPFRRVDVLPEPSADAWAVTGAAQLGAWRAGTFPRSTLTVDHDWISVRRPTLFGGVEHYLAGRDAVGTVVVVGIPRLRARVGVRGHRRASRLAVGLTDPTSAEAELDRLGWPHERARPRLLRPFR